LGETYDFPEREVLIHNTYETKWAVRKGDWLFMNVNSGEHRRMPEFFKELRGYTDFETDGLLFNLEKDPEQRINLYEDYPEMVKEMDRLITLYKVQGYLIKDN
jgi:arylsulfatase A